MSKTLARLLFAIPLLFSYGLGTSAHDMEMHEDASSAELGHVHFPVSCAAAVQGRFDQAVVMLHSFWYEKAGAEFSAIIKDDPACAMAYWGMAMTYYHPLWDKPNPETLQNGWAVLQQAESAKEQTPRERGYIAALEAFYRDQSNPDYPDRALAYEAAMGKLHKQYPEDSEASVFYALALVASAQALPADKTHAREKKAAAILTAVQAHNPQHPGVLHYLIHAYDSPELASLALPAARNYAKIAPEVPHALHMPSHIFTRLGLWKESIQSNLASQAAARKFEAETHMDGAWDERLHVMDYLMYAYLQRGQDKQAQAVLANLHTIHKTIPVSFKVAYAFAAIPARYAIERGDWTGAATLPLYPVDFPWDRFLWAEAITDFARGIGAARSGNMRTAAQAVGRLTQIKAALQKANDPYWVQQVEIQRLSVLAWLNHAQGNDSESARVMELAADLEDRGAKHPVTPGPILPARELLGDLLLELHQPSDALREFTASLTNSPNRLGGLLGAARAARTSGDATKARDFYQRLMTVGDQADSDNPAAMEAREYLSAPK